MAARGIAGDRPGARGGPRGAAARAVQGGEHPFRDERLDMGIQIIFDTGGITDGFATSPKGQVVYQFRSKGGMKAIGGQTEGFLEGIEPQITELLSALGCDRSSEEEEISIDELQGVARGRLHTQGQTPGRKV